MVLNLYFSLTSDYLVIIFIFIHWEFTVNVFSALVYILDLEVITCELTVPEIAKVRE